MQIYGWRAARPGVYEYMNFPQRSHQPVFGYVSICWRTSVVNGCIYNKCVRHLPGWIIPWSLQHRTWLDLSRSLLWNMQLLWQLWCEFKATVGSECCCPHHLMWRVIYWHFGVRTMFGSLFFRCRKHCFRVLFGFTRPKLYSLDTFFPITVLKAVCIPPVQADKFSI